MTRIAPRELDIHDNLPSAFKYVLDSICDFIVPGLKPGRADGRNEIASIEYFQRKGGNKQYGLEVEIQTIDNSKDIQKYLVAV
jgi:hypothetical protein